MRAFLFKYPWLAGLLGFIFLLAGVGKLGNPALTFAGIQQYELLDANLAYFLAEWLPWFEIALGLALWLPVTRTVAAGIAGGVQVLFLAALIQALIRGLEVTCVCFGAPFGQAASLLAQELSFLVLTALVLWRERKIARK